MTPLMTRFPLITGSPETVVHFNNSQLWIMPIPQYSELDQHFYQTRKK